MISLDTIFKSIDYLPPFPVTVTKVMRMLRDPKVTAEELADTVKFDQALTANMLKLCNSSYYGLRRTVSNLREAVVYLGLSELKKMIVRTGTKQYFENQHPGYESEKGEMWRQAIATSIIAEKLAVRVGDVNADYAFIAGLLHDVGKLVFSEYVMKSSQDIFTLVDDQHMSFLDAELQVLGYTHSQVGAFMLERWDFPEEIVSAVRKHHDPVEEGDTVIENIVRLADSLAMLMGYETSIDGLAYKGYSGLCASFNLKHSDVDTIIAESQEEISHVESEYGLSREV